MNLSFKQKVWEKLHNYKKKQMLISEHIEKTIKDKEIYNIEYELATSDNMATITITGDLKNPLLVTDDGQVNTRRNIIENGFTFLFDFSDMPEMNSNKSRVMILDSDKIYRLARKCENEKDNYNNIVNVWYTNSFIYYFRNTASKDGRLVFQRKQRKYFESTAFNQKQMQLSEQYKDSKTNGVLIYEKDISRFEESAAYLFKQIFDCPNVHYVLSKDATNYNELKKLYKDKIISPDEDRFIELLFKSEYYIGTELPIHLLTTDSPYSNLRYEVMDENRHKFIFLQDGVNYLFSIEGSKHSVFRKQGLYKPYKIVVSSQIEADYLMRDGNYTLADIWTTGLPVFDNKRINVDAKMTTVMLAWRPWDEGKELMETTYYQALLKIFENITEKKNLQFVLHPKFKVAVTAESPLYNYMCNDSIDTVLENTKVLLSDYSSMMFDAFYRGSNVIFWWEEKDVCLQKYSNHLLLTESNVFGDIVYESKYLDEILLKNSTVQTNMYYVNKYRNIVEFRDDQNTNRVIQKLELYSII